MKRSLLVIWSTLSARRRTLLAGALLAGAIAFALLRITHLHSVGGVRFSAAAWVLADFKSTAYYPAKAFAEGGNPYDTPRYMAQYPAPEPFRMYPPAMLLLNQPFAAMPVDLAGKVKFIVTLLLSGVLAYVSLRLARVPVTAPKVLLIWGLILFSRPGQWNLLQGQMTLPLVLATYAAIALDRRHWVLAGTALAFCMIKPSYGLPLAIFLLAREQFAALGVGAAFTLALNLPFALILVQRAGGVNALFSDYLLGQHNLRRTIYPQTEVSFYRIDAGAFPTRLSEVPMELAIPVMAILVLGLAVYPFRRRLREASGSDALAAGLMCTAILLSIYHIGYDLLLLTWPFVALVWPEHSGLRTEPAMRWVAIGILAVLAANYATSFALLQAIQPHHLIWLLLASLNGILLLALFGFYFGEALRPGVAPGRRRPSEWRAKVDWKGSPLEHRLASVSVRP
ncbi:MAG TPA: glycosyltransferase family 87 protein [Gemmatimonadales bacterium]|jgi:hypothetical protein